MQLPKSPRGLLEIIRARSQGRSPTELADTVIAVIDATAMYGSDTLQGQTTTGPAAAITANTIATMEQRLTAPGRIFAMSGQLTVGAAAGTQIRLNLGFRHTLGAQTVWVEDRIITAPVAGTAFVIGFAFPYPWVFAPGAQFLFNTQGDAGGADHVPQLVLLYENLAGNI